MSERLIPTQTQTIPNTIGNFTGDTLIQDSETGLLVSPDEPRSYAQLRNGNGFSPLSVFSAVKKLQALNLLYDWYPDISKVCSMIGITRQTFTNHLAVDQVFRECVEEIKHRVIDRIHLVRMHVASTPAGSFDRMCVLNAHMPELYNPKTVIQIEHSMSAEQASKRDSRISDIIDAEVVETVRKAKKLKTGNAL